MEKLKPSEEFLYRYPKNEAFLVKNDVFTPLSQITSEQFQEKPIFLMHHHNQAGKVWDRAFELGIIGEKSHLLHVDAHDDLAINEPFPGSEQQVGSFILPRVENGIISKITWITKNPFKFNPDSPLMYPNSLNSPLLSNKPTIEEVSLLQQKQSFDLLDIDLDYFTEDLPRDYPNLILRFRVRQFIHELMKKTEGIKVTTIAISPGYIQNGRELVLIEEVLKAIKSK